MTSRPRPGMLKTISVIDRAADQHRGGHPDHGHHRHQRVAEGVHVGDRALRQPLGPRGAHVVLLEGLEHARAADARDQGRLVEAERDRGQHHVAQRACTGSREERRVARGGQPAQAHREEVDEVEAQPEAGHADPEQGADHEHAVPDRAPVGGGHDAGGHPDRHRHQEGARPSARESARPAPGSRWSPAGPGSRTGRGRRAARGRRTRGAAEQRPVEPERLAGAPRSGSASRRAPASRSPDRRGSGG